jgi:hypothetical protein
MIAHVNMDRGQHVFRELKEFEWSWSHFSHLYQLELGDVEAVSRCIYGKNKMSGTSVCIDASIRDGFICTSYFMPSNKHARGGIDNQKTDETPSDTTIGFE